MNLDNEFNRLLENFVYKKLTENRNQSNVSLSNIKDMTKSMIYYNILKQKDNSYSTEIIKYMDDNNYLKEKIIERAKDFLSQDKNAEMNSQKIIDKIMHNNCICKNSIDIISFTLNYIK